MSEIVVIGAGPAGLTAAYELSKLGLRTTVLEADEYVGGRARTVNYIKGGPQVGLHLRLLAHYFIGYSVS